MLDCAKEVMGNLSLFGKPIGKNIIPKILFGRKKILGVYTIDEIQLKFTRILIDNEIKAKLQAISRKPFSGPTEKLNPLLILPSAEHVCTSFQISYTKNIYINLYVCKILEIYVGGNI